MTVYIENLIAALDEAIAARREHERKVLGYYGDSAMVEGWEEVLEWLKEERNRQVEKVDLVARLRRAVE